MEALTRVKPVFSLTVSVSDIFSSPPSQKLAPRTSAHKKNFPAHCANELWPLCRRFL